MITTRHFFFLNIYIKFNHIRKIITYKNNIRIPYNSKQENRKIKYIRVGKTKLYKNTFMQICIKLPFKLQ